MHRLLVILQKEIFFLIMGSMAFVCWGMQSHSGVSTRSQAVATEIDKALNAHRIEDLVSADRMGELGKFVVHLLGGRGEWL